MVKKAGQALVLGPGDIRMPMHDKGDARRKHQTGECREVGHMGMDDRRLEPPDGQGQAPRKARRDKGVAKGAKHGHTLDDDARCVLDVFPLLGVEPVGENKVLHAHTGQPRTQIAQVGLDATGRGGVIFSNVQ